MIRQPNNAVQTKYTWGLDMSGLAGDGTTQGIHGAGGIGGLLAAVETGGTYQGTYWFLYDGNGNVGQVLDATDTQNIAVAARYEYDPFGRLIVTAGDYADANPFRFSTKWLDTELAGLDSTSAVGPDGLAYYGYRFYSPNLGRWINRDPIEEEGGLNLYGFVINRSIDSIDAHGLIEWCGPMGCVPMPRPLPPPQPGSPMIIGGTGRLGDLIDCMGKCLDDNKAAQKGLCVLGITGVGNIPTAKPPGMPGAGIPGMNETRLINRVLKGRALRCCKALRGAGTVIPAGGVALGYEVYCLVKCL